MRSSVDFSRAVRQGRRVRRGAVVVHLAAPDVADSNGRADPVIVGFVVAKSVGGSVVRHRVSRRLRAVMASRLDSLPTGSAAVVRALPPAAGASSADLAVDVDAALARLTRTVR